MFLNGQMRIECYFKWHYRSSWRRKRTNYSKRGRIQRLVCLGKKKGKVPDRGVLFDRREDYGIGLGPCDGCVLTVGVDV